MEKKFVFIGKNKKNVWTIEDNGNKSLCVYPHYFLHLLHNLTYSEAIERCRYEINCNIDSYAIDIPWPEEIEIDNGFYISIEKFLECMEIHKDNMQKWSFCR